MSATNYPPLTRVPGRAINPKDHALDKDLTKLTKRELLDVIARQEEQLRNKSRLEKLPDKGEKVQRLYDRAVKALETKNEIESASNLLASLSLGTKDVDNLEWQNVANQKDILDSDDDEDPIAILASNTVNRSQRIFKQEDESDRKLITEDDLREAEEIVKGLLHLDPVLERVIENENLDPSTRFLPHKPKFRSNSVIETRTRTASFTEPRFRTSSFTESRLRAGSFTEGTERKIRDNSAATPPVHEHGAKLLSLRASIELEHAHQMKLKMLQAKQAADRLAMKQESQSEIQPTASKLDNISMSKYRLASSLVDDFDIDVSDDDLSDEIRDDD